MTSTITEVVKLDQEEEKIAISKDKNNLRRMDINNSGGKIVDATGKSDIVAIGKGSDLLALIHNGIDPTETP